MQDTEQRFWIMRHGETEANASGRIQGSTNTASNLTETGKRQAMEAGKRLANIMRMDGNHRYRVIDHVYISPLSRARETLDYMRRGATCSSSSSNIDEEYDSNILPEDTIIVVHPELTGIPLYDWEGQNIRDLKEQDPDVYRAWIEGDAQKFRIAGHSPVSEVWDRAARLWPTVLRCPTKDAKNDDDSLAKTTLIVCHGTLSQALLATAFGWDESVFRKHDFPNAGLVELIWRVQDSHAYCWRWLYPQSTEWIYPDSVPPARVVKKDGLD